MNIVLIFNRKKSRNLLLNTLAKLITTCALKTQVLATILHYYKKKIRETMKIEKFANNINDGLKLRKAWKPVVQLIKNNLALTLFNK
jgi:hypothetical protein